MTIAVGFPPQPWNPVDPIILDGAIALWPGLLSDCVMYGGDERYSDPDMAADLAARCDWYVKVGTPAWWNQNDRDVYAAFIEAGKPILLWGIGVGGGDAVWDGFQQDADLMRRLATHATVIARDENAYNMLRRSGATDVHLMPCPGMFASGLSRHRDELRVVAFDVLDPCTVIKDGLYTCEAYYAFVAAAVLALTDRGFDVRLCCQRPFGDMPPSGYERCDPSAWTVDGDDVRCWLARAGVDRTDEMRPFLSAAQMDAFYHQADLYVGSRVHGALPRVGSGCPAIAIPIDMRHSALRMAGYGLRMLPFSPPTFDLGAFELAVDAVSTCLGQASEACLSWARMWRGRHHKVLAAFASRKVGSGATGDGETETFGDEVVR